MNRFYRIYTFAVLAVFAALPFAESLNADPIWTKRDVLHGHGHDELR